MSTSTITHTDTGTLVWSPDGTKLAYITSRGLQAYIMDDPSSDDEQHVMLSSAAFTEVNWSPTGDYLLAQSEKGPWLLFQFSQSYAQQIHAICATSFEWTDDHQLVYVPVSGGLVIVNLGNQPTEIKLAG
jgi:WD40 repeat protein